MASRELRLELLLGRIVRSARGRPIGRIDDFRAEPDGDEYLLHQVIIGELGLMARLLSAAGKLPTLRSLGLHRRYRRRAVPWEWIDWSDLENPHFLGSVLFGETGGEGGHGGTSGRGGTAD